MMIYTSYKNFSVSDRVSNKIQYWLTYICVFLAYRFGWLSFVNQNIIEDYLKNSLVSDNPVRQKSKTAERIREQLKFMCVLIANWGGWLSFVDQNIIKSYLSVKQSSEREFSLHKLAQQFSILMISAIKSRAESFQETIQPTYVLEKLVFKGMAALLLGTTCYLIYTIPVPINPSPHKPRNPDDDWTSWAQLALIRFQAETPPIFGSEQYSFQNQNVNDESNSLVFEWQFWFETELPEPQDWSQWTLLEPVSRHANNAMLSILVSDTNNGILTADADPLFGIWDIEYDGINTNNSILIADADTLFGIWNVEYGWTNDGAFYRTGCFSIGVPEPSILILFGLGSLGIWGRRKWSKM